MEGHGALAIGLVVGWLLPSVRMAGERAAVASAGMVGAIAAGVLLLQGVDVAAVSGVGAAIGALVHALWREDLRRRYRPAQ